jgi:hypothetical protein
VELEKLLPTLALKDAGYRQYFPTAPLFGSALDDYVCSAH